MSFVVGIDEVGRGSWAGPLLVVAARAKSTLPAGLIDSKQLSKLRRESLYDLIKEACLIGEGWVQPEEIDTHGLAGAMRIGVSRALVSLGVAFNDEIVMDGNVNYCPKEFLRASAVIRADSLHPVVSAASIYAKVKRDRYMVQIAKLYPNYQFDKHVGYGTELHRTLLNEHGVSALHRRSYKPVKDLT